MAKKAAKPKKVSNLNVSVEPEVTRGFYATWDWNRTKTDSYTVEWDYRFESDKVLWLKGSTDTGVKVKNARYTAPDNAVEIRVKVRPIASKVKKGKKSVSAWTAGWCAYQYYAIANMPPETPNTPNITVKDLKLTVSVSLAADSRTTEVEFEIVRDNSTIYATQIVTAAYQQATFVCNVPTGSKYKVRCRARRGGSISEKWSDYSSEVETPPVAISAPPTVKALTKTSVRVDWNAVDNVTGYDVEYASDKDYFDSSGEAKSTSVTVNHAEITGLEEGKTWWFRVRAKNSSGESTWSAATSITMGRAPAAPTTWSSTVTAIKGEDLILYWVHNSEDGSSQTYAELELTVNGSSQTITVANTTDELHKDETSKYTLHTSDYSEGAKIQWRVRTRGIIAEYGPWSIQRSITVCAPPTVQVVLNTAVLTMFPFKMAISSAPKTQKPTGYYVTIKALDSYETLSDTGRVTRISAGDEIYRKNFDISDYSLSIELNPGDVDFENNVQYEVTASVYMDSGLSASATANFTVAWTDEELSPDAEIWVDQDVYSASIYPYCEDDDGNLIADVTLSVYRREFDGKFTEIATDLPNTHAVCVTDLHPALDYARYRIVARSTTTGAISYYDMPGYPIECGYLIFQWDEEWTNYIYEDSDDDPVDSARSNSMVFLPYNIDIDESSSPDVALVEYIGREHPVSYYGTQVGETATWKTVVPSTDSETMYQLRRLSVYMGDVYVRAPSGIGYWANVVVKITDNHNELYNSISFTIKRVEGGM